MQITYDAKYDLLYIKLGEGQRQVDTKVVDEDINLDFDEDDRLHGIEVLDASKRVDLSAFLPVAMKASNATAAEHRPSPRARRPRAGTPSTHP